MAMKKITFGFAILASIILVSSAILASINTMEWVGVAGDTATIVKGDSIQFEVSVNSFDPGAHYTIDLFDSNYNLIRNIRSGVTGADIYSERITLTAADYNNIGGTFHVRTYSTEGAGLQLREDVDTLNLVVTQLAPIVLDIPDVTIEEGTSYTIDLNDYVIDFDDTVASMVWTVAGNTNIIVSISAGNIATITAPLGWTGTETLTFTATDPSGDSDSDTVTVTVVPVGTLDSSDDHEFINVKDMTVESFGDGMIMVRNNGNEFNDVMLEVNIEASDAPENVFRFDISPNTVRYFTMDTEGLSGDYLAQIDISSDDSEASGFIILSV